MQKTKLISKSFPHDRKNTRETDQSPEDELSNNPPHIEQELFPIYQFSPTYTSPQQTYSLQDFIQNLQSEHLLYQGYFDHYDQINAPAINRRPIEQINCEYLQKMGAVDKKEQSYQPKILFVEEMTVKYYCQNDAPQSIAKYEEYAYPIDKHFIQEQQILDVI